jgi:hypothetical protein
MPEQMRTAISELASTRADRAIPMPWELWRGNFMQTASEQLARDNFQRLVPEPYRCSNRFGCAARCTANCPPPSCPSPKTRPCHRGSGTRGMSSRLNGATVTEIDGDHEIPLTAPGQLSGALHRLATAAG